MVLLKCDQHQLHFTLCGDDGLRGLHLERPLRLILVLKALLTQRYLTLLQKRPAVRILLGPQFGCELPVLQVEGQHCRHELTANLQKLSQQGAAETLTAPPLPRDRTCVTMGMPHAPPLSTSVRDSVEPNSFVPQPWIQLLNATDALRQPSLRSNSWHLSHSSLRISSRAQTTDDVEVVPEPRRTPKVDLTMANQLLQRLI